MLKINTKKFDPENWPEGVWVKFAEGAELKIRKLSVDVFQELRKPFVRTEMVHDKKTHRFVPGEKMDKESEDKFNDAVIDFLIEDQKGFGDENGNAFMSPPTLDNKKALLNAPEISDFIWSFAGSLEIAEADKIQEETGN